MTSKNNTPGAVVMMLGLVAAGLCTMAAQDGSNAWYAGTVIGLLALIGGFLMLRSKGQD